MNRTELQALIKRELRSIQPDKLPADWSEHALLREDLVLDSLDLVEMIARLEQATGVFVPDVDVPQLATVHATAEYLLARQAAPAVVVAVVPAVSAASQT